MVRSCPSRAASMNARIAPPPIWPGPVDVERPHRHRRQAELVVVRVRHVLAGELRDRIGPAGLADRARRRDVALLDVDRLPAEHLAGREVDEALERRAHRGSRLEHVVGADDVHAHRAHRALDHGLDPGDRRAVDDVRRTGQKRRERGWIEHVQLVEGEVRMLGELGAGERVAVEIVERDDLVRVDEPRRQGRADEAGAARDQDPLARQRHAASLALSPDRFPRVRRV